MANVTRKDIEALERLKDRLAELPEVDEGDADAFEAHLEERDEILEQFLRQLDEDDGS